MDAEDRDGHRDGQLEVVAGGREREGRRLRVVGAEPVPHVERHEEHHHEVDQQRDRDPDDVHRQLHDVLALEREHHHDREEQRDERQRADLRHERRLVPLPAAGPYQREAGQHAGEERNPQVDEDALGDLPDRHVDDDARQSEPLRQDRDEDPRVDRVEEHLEHRVERDQAGGVFRVTLRQLVPDDDHRDAPGEADHDQADHVLVIGDHRRGRRAQRRRHDVQEDQREGEHQDRADDPVLDERQREDLRVAEDLAQFLVADLRQRAGTS